MNKLLLNVLFALLLVGGFSVNAHAIAIPEGEDASTGPAPWLVPVYNNASTTLAVGDVVIWDIDSSTGKDDNYVNTTTTADTVLVAGVVYGAAITAGNKGMIAVHGVVPINVVQGGNTVKGPLCTSATAGKARSCSVDTARFAVVTTVGVSGVASGFVEALQ